MSDEERRRLEREAGDSAVARLQLAAERARRGERPCLLLDANHSHVRFSNRSVNVIGREGSRFYHLPAEERLQVEVALLRGYSAADAALNLGALFTTAGRVIYRDGRRYVLIDLGPSPRCRHGLCEVERGPCSLCASERRRSFDPGMILGLDSDYREREEG